MTDAHERSPRLPPRFIVRSFWAIHRIVHRLTGGRRGLWPPRPGKWGAMRLITVGRRSGMERSAILGYYEDGANLVTMAMNGWAEAEPAWWLNLQANPDTTVVLADGPRAVRARAAQGMSTPDSGSDGATSAMTSMATLSGGLPGLLSWCWSREPSRASVGRSRLR